MQNPAGNPSLQQNQGRLIPPNNIDLYRPIFILLLNNILHQYKSSEECFNCIRDQILKLYSYQNLTQLRLLMQNTDTPSIRQVADLFDIDISNEIKQVFFDPFLSGAEINQIVELVQNQMNIIQPAYNLSDDQSQELQEFYSAQIQKFIEFQIDETLHLYFLNPDDFQRFMFFQLNYLNTFLDFLFNNFNLFTQYLNGNFRSLLNDFDLRIQIMISIQYEDFLSIRQNIDISSNTNYNFDDEIDI